VASSTTRPADSVLADRSPPVPTCRPETLAFTATAPLRVTVSREIAATPDRVFATLADTGSWPRWFPGLHAARWTSPRPYGVGSTREVSVGPMDVTEEFIVWEPGERWGFTFVATSLPLARAGVELVELVELAAGRTRVVYTIALEPTGVPARLAQLAAPLGRVALGRGLDGLDRHVTGG
jgi:uncharacterized protein YndB with AHSA1/START domain